MSAKLPIIKELHPQPLRVLRATVYTQVELPPLIPPYKGGKQENKSSSLPFIRGGLGWGSWGVSN